MKLTLTAAASILLGASVALYCRRYVGAFLWWMFTADLRSGR